MPFIFFDVFHYICLPQNVFMEEALIKKHLKQGDERAFKYLYEQHYAFLCRFAAQLTNDISLAEEMVDDVIFYLWEHHTEIEISGPLRNYLLRAVRNRCLNELNSQTYRMEQNCSSYLLPENVQLIENLFPSEDHPLENILTQELEDLLRQSIEELPDACRTVFKKSRFEEKKYEEIASELNISINTVKYHIKNALDILQKKMAPYLEVLFLYFFIKS